MNKRILEILNLYGGDYRKFINAISKGNIYKDIRNEIILSTSFLDKFGSIKIRERIYCILNEMYDRPKCKNCQNYSDFNRVKYREFCSPSCVGVFNSEKIGISNRINNIKNGNSIKEKRIETTKRKYGCENVMKIDFFKEKLKRSLVDKTGYEFPLQNQLSREKFKSTCLLNFSSDNPSRSEKVKKKKEETCIKNHGVSNGLKTKYARERLTETRNEKYNLYNKNQLSKGTYSKKSQIIFWKIYDMLPEYLREKTYFAELNKEFVITGTNKNSYFYDFVISNIKVCIEYNGDNWHANPEIFESNDVPLAFIGLKSHQIWEKDEVKNKTIQERGFKLFIIWESDGEEKIQEILDYILSINLVN